MKFNPKLDNNKEKNDNHLRHTAKKNIEDYKKADLIKTILLEKGFRCFVEVDSKYIRIEELENHLELSRKKICEILELENIEIAQLRTGMGMFNIFYIPITY